MAVERPDGLHSATLVLRRNPKRERGKRLRRVSRLRFGLRFRVFRAQVALPS